MIHSNPVTVIVRCPKCGEYGEMGWAVFMRGERLFCDFCRKGRMRQATEEEVEAYERVAGKDYRINPADL